MVAPLLPPKRKVLRRLIASIKPINARRGVSAMRANLFGTR
jgi:hypothetical protein